MKSTVLGVWVALLAGCAGSSRSPATPAYGAPPLWATVDGRPFTPRGILGRPIGGDSVLVQVFERPVACGTPTASGLPGERLFQVHVPSWSTATNGVHIDLWNSHAAVNTVRVLPEGNGASAKAMGGSIDILSAGPAGGTIVVDARNEDGALQGQIPFALCR